MTMPAFYKNIDRLSPEITIESGEQYACDPYHKMF